MKAVAEYNYTDRFGELLYQVVRFEPKAFRQRRPDGQGGWAWQLDGVRRVPYNLPQILGSAPETIYLAEGEKDCEELLKLGLIATTNAGGANTNWTPEMVGYLAGRNVVVLADNDASGLDHANTVCSSLQGTAKSVRLVWLPGLKEKGDVSDWLSNGHTREELELIAAQTPEWEFPAPSGGEAVAVFDGAVDAVALVADVEDFINRFVKLPTGMTLALALWAIGTHLFQSFEVFPYLAITGPAKRCGKTRLTETLALLCAKARRTSNISEAALFRIIEALQPTLIIDEAEALADKRSERSQFLAAILNSGHRIGANVIRCVGPQHQVAEFRTFGPKVIVAIGALRDTLADRSLMVQMQRKSREDQVGRFLLKTVKPIADKLLQQIAKVALNHRAAIEKAFEKIDIEDLEDREAENWSPLFAICEVLVPERLIDLKATAVVNGKEKESEDADASLQIKLLTDIRDVLIERNLGNGDLFAQKPNAGISSRELLEELRAIEESPWTREDLNLTARGLARMLRPFGLFSSIIDTKSGPRARGYRLSSLSARLSVYARSTRTTVQDDEKK
jgi:hypothetical protein